MPIYLAIRLKRTNFFESQKLPNLKNRENINMNKPMKEIKFLVKIFPTKKNTGQEVFTDVFYQTIKKSNIAKLTKTL